MTEIAIATMGAILTLIFGLIGTLYAILVREINLLRKTVHQLANEITSIKSDVGWIEKQIEHREHPYRDT